MGKASSSKKVQRAARAAGRPGAKKNYGWPLAMTAVVIVGVLLIVLTVSTNDDTEPGSPKVGEHWHAAFGIYDCDHYISPPVDDGPDREGIHTHGDGLMHIHPFVSRVAGDNANLEAFAKQLGMGLSDTSVDVGDFDRENGGECDGEEGRLQLVTWDNRTDDTPTVITKNIKAYDPDDQSIWVLAFVPEGTDVPKPPSAANLADPTAAEEGREPVVGRDDTTSTTAAEGSETTTTAPTSETTAPASTESTTTTAAP